MYANEHKILPNQPLDIIEFKSRVFTSTFLDWINHHTYTASAFLSISFLNKKNKPAQSNNSLNIECFTPPDRQNRQDNKTYKKP